MSSIPGFLTLAEVARVIGRSHAQITRYIHDERLPAAKVGTQYLVKEKDAEKFTPPPRGNPAFRTKKRRSKKG